MKGLLRHVGGGLVQLFEEAKLVRDIGVTPGWHWEDRDELIVRFNQHDTLRAHLEAAEARHAATERDACRQAEQANEWKTRAEAAEAECADMRARMHFLATDGCVEGFTNVAGDIYDYACDSAEERGRDEPNDDDLTNGLCRLVDAARTKEQQA